MRHRIIPYTMLTTIRFITITQSGALYIVQLQIFHLLNLQCNVPLMCVPSIIAEPLEPIYVKF